MSKNKIISLLCPIAFLIFGIWVRISAMSFQRRDAIFPIMVAYVTIVIAILELISEMRKTEHKDRFKNVNFGCLGACIVAMFLYIFLLKKIGFFIDTTLLCAFTMWALGYRRWKMLVPSAILISALVFGAFYGLMRVPLPTIIL